MSSFDLQAHKGFWQHDVEVALFRDFRAATTMDSEWFASPRVDVVELPLASLKIDLSLPSRSS